MNNAIQNTVNKTKDISNSPSLFENLRFYLSSCIPTRKDLEKASAYNYSQMLITQGLAVLKEMSLGGNTNKQIFKEEKEYELQEDRNNRDALSEMKRVLVGGND